MLGLSIPSFAYRQPTALAARIAALFRSGEQGVWYDPSDRATLFQDASGTTPVTAVEQPVGLIGTPQRVGPGPWDLRDLLATQPLILPTRETALRSAFDALLARLGVAPVLAAEVDDMAMIRLLTRADAGLAIIPPIVVRDELQSGSLIEAARLEGIGETFFAVTRQRRFPNPLLAEVLPA